MKVEIVNVDGHAYNLIVNGWVKLIGESMTVCSMVKFFLENPEFQDSSEPCELANQIRKSI